jgi:hypothetical protein
MFILDTWHVYCHGIFHIFLSTQNPISPRLTLLIPFMLELWLGEKFHYV